MTGPAISEDDPVAAYLRTKQQPTETDPVAAYLATKRPTPTGHNGVPFVNAKPEEAPGLGTKALGTLAALGRDIPFVEAAQAKARSVLRGQPYAEARQDIRGAEDAAPSAATGPARLIGGGLVAATPAKYLGLGATSAGALYGALSGLGDSEEQSVEDRAGKTVMGGAIGGAVGAAGPKLVKIGGKFAAPIVRAGQRAAGGISEAFSSLPKTIEGSLYPAEVLQPGEPVAPLMRAIARPVARLPQGAIPKAAPEAAQEVASDVAAAVKPLRPQAHRTAAQFAEFARRSGRTLPGAPATSAATQAVEAAPTAENAALDRQLTDLLAKVRAAQPQHVASTVGDAEAAMGLAPEQQPDLEDLLRRSLAALGGKKP